MRVLGSKYINNAFLRFVTRSVLLVSTDMVNKLFSEGRSYFRGRGDCDLQAGVVLSLWLAPSSVRDKRKLIDIWRVSGPITLSWEILMTICKFNNAIL